jgi:cytidylate kinase
MIVTVSGTPGSGKSTLARGLAEALGFRHYSAGEFMRQIAKERGMTILELSRAAEQRETIDKEIDERTRRLAGQEDDFVIDARLAWHFIPKSVKIFVRADLRRAAERIFKDMRSDEKENTSAESTWKNLQTRMESERQRYIKYYGVNYLDGKNYDFVIDSTENSIGETLEKALALVKQYIKKG